MGAALFVKSPQGYALTDLGERMKARAAEAEVHLARIKEEGQGDRTGLTGQVRIGAPDGAANYLLPQVCAAIQADNPALEVQIVALPRVVNLSQARGGYGDYSQPASGRAADGAEDHRLSVASCDAIRCAAR